MKLRPLSQLVLQQTLQRHQLELQQLIEVLKDNDAAPSSALIDLTTFSWATPPTETP